MFGVETVTPPTLPTPGRCVSMLGSEKLTPFHASMTAFSSLLIPPAIAEPIRSPYPATFFAICPTAFPSASVVSPARPASLPGRLLIPVAIAEATFCASERTSPAALPTAVPTLPISPVAQLARSPTPVFRPARIFPPSALAALSSAPPAASACAGIFASSPFAHAPRSPRPVLMPSSARAPSVVMTCLKTSHASLITPSTSLSAPVTISLMPFHARPQSPVIRPITTSITPRIPVSTPSMIWWIASQCWRTWPTSHAVTASIWISAGWRSLSHASLTAVKTCSAILRICGQFVSNHAMTSFATPRITFEICGQ
jgi:hypothetical protein